MAKPAGRIKSADPINRDDQGNIIPLSERFQPTEADIRFAAIDPAKLQKPDDMDSQTQAEVSENMANRAEAKKAQLNLLGHSILEDEIPEEYVELTNEDYENGMAFQDFKFSKAYNFNNPTYAPFIAAQWLRLNGGLMPTVKVQGLELSKPEKGTAEAESLRLLKRAISIGDSRSEVRGGKELTYSLGDIMATWMESGLGEAALRNAIVQFTNLDVSIAEKAAANFAEVYRLAQVVQDTKNRAETGVERGIPTEMKSQHASEEFMQSTTLGFALTMSLCTVGISSILVWLTFSWGWPVIGGFVALFLVYVLLQGPPTGLPLLPSHRRGFVPFLWAARILFFLLIFVSVAVLHKFGGVAGWLIFLALQFLVSPLLVLFAYKIRTVLLWAPYKELETLDSQQMTSVNQMTQQNKSSRMSSEEVEGILGELVQLDLQKRKMK